MLLLVSSNIYSQCLEKVPMFIIGGQSNAMGRGLAADLTSAERLSIPNYNIYCWANQMSDEKDKTRILKISKNENIKIILTDFDENFLRK